MSEPKGRPALSAAVDDLKEIQRHAQMIVNHRDKCEYWTGHGCEISMLHDAEDILKLVDPMLRRTGA